MVNEHGAITQELRVLAEDYKQELSEATRSLETVKQELSTMQYRKDALQGEAERLKALNNQTADKIREANEAIKKYSSTLLNLQNQLNEAKSELSVVETAIKEKKAEGTEKFGLNGVMERIGRARKEINKDNHIKALEARISLFERFISLPLVKPLWEEFQAFISKEKPQKDHER